MLPVFLVSAALAGPVARIHDRLAEDYAGPGWTNLDLADPALLTDAERTRLADGSRREVNQLLRQLHESGDPAAAVLLALRSEARAVPELERWFLLDDYYYGWESCTPCEIEPNNWPDLEVYTQALRALTGQSPEERIHPSTQQVAWLEATDRTYALAALAPDRAMAIYAAKFRASAPDERIFSAAPLAHLLHPGLTREAVLGMLGAPEEDAVDASVWHLGDPGCGPRALTLRWSGPALVQAELTEDL